MLASDLTALCRFTNRYFVVPEYHILKLSADKLTLTDFEGNEVLPKYLTVDWELNSAGKNGYPFYMEKEIMEQPEAIENTIRNRIVGFYSGRRAGHSFYRVRAYLHRSVRNRNARGTGGTGARQVHSSHAH
jgi:glucosamine 6-phosphate synthetase-like amidotransferase/phosphosugar isomerase protein